MAQGSRRNLELAMRIALDIEEAQKSLPVVEQGLGAVENAGKKAGAGLDAVSKGAKDAADAIDRAGKSSQAAGDALQKTGADAAASAKGLDAAKKTATTAGAALDKAGDQAATTGAQVQQAGSQVQQASAKAAVAVDREAAALQRQNEIRDRLVKLLNTQRGQNIQVAEGQRQAANATGAAAAALKGGAISAGQYQAAMRQLPMQITDITTSIVSGMPIWMVAIQQGGQLKDSFGGIVPASKALLSTLSPTVVVVGALAVAVGAVVAAWKQATDETWNFQRALILTNNYAGVSVKQLQAMRDQLDQVAGVSRGDAAAALTAVAESGRFAGEQFREVSRSATVMQAATGQAIDTTIGKFEELAKDPVQALLKLNETEHFLTRAQLDRVQALVKEGKEQQAVAEAVRIYSDHLDNVAAKANEAMPVVSRWWRDVKDETAGAWGEVQTYVELLDKVIQRQKLLSSGPKLTAGTLAGFIPDGWLQGAGTLANALGKNWLRQQAGADFSDVTSKVTAQSSGSAVVDSQVAKARMDAQKKWDDLVQSNLSKQAKLEKEIADIRKTGLAAGKDEATIEKEIAEARARYKESLPKAAKTEAQKDEVAAQRELERLKQQIQLVGTLDDQRKKATETTRIQAAIAEGNYKNASAATKQQLLDQAKLLDAANLRYSADQKMLEVNQRIAALQGNKEDGQLLKARRELEALKQDLLAQGRTTDADTVSKLLGLQQASTDLVNLRQQYDQVMADIALETQRIQIEQQTGLITETEAQQKVVDLYRQKLGTLRTLVPQMRAAATALGDPQALANVGQIELKLEEMAATTNRLQQSITSTFKTSIADTLNSLADGTTSLAEAVNKFFASIAQGIVNYFAQDWAETAGNWLKGQLGSLLGGGTSDTAAVTSATAAASITTAGAATAGIATTTAATSAAGILTGGGAAAGQALIAAAYTAAAIMTSSSTAKGVVTVGTAVAAGAATGGHITGPGTGTSDSIPVNLSNGEFVHRAAVVRQPGALGFLYDFNRRGMAALRDWRQNFAVGGLVTPVPTAAMAPRASISDNRAALASAQAKNMRLYLLQDQDELVQRLAGHPAFEQAVVATAGRNGTAIRAEW